MEHRVRPKLFCTRWVPKSAKTYVTASASACWTPGIASLCHAMQGVVCPTWCDKQRHGLYVTALAMTAWLAEPRSPLIHQALARSARNGTAAFAQVLPFLQAPCTQCCSIYPGHRNIACPKTAVRPKLWLAAPDARSAQKCALSIAKNRHTMTALLLLHLPVGSRASHRCAMPCGVPNARPGAASSATACM